jgi:drug/metabolite transporter (DMT)-like permease
MLRRGRGPVKAAPAPLRYTRAAVDPAARAGAAPAALRAAGWMALSIASFVLMSVAARQLSGRMHTIEILFFRSLVSLALLLALRPRLGAEAFTTRQPALQLARNVVHFGGQYSWVWGIALAPLAVVTAIEFTTPIWVALLGALLLGERVAPHRWAAIAGGLAGVAMIVRPGTAAFGAPAVVVLAAAFCFAGSVLMVKRLLRTDRVVAVLFHMSLIQLPLGLVPALFVWVAPGWADAPWLLAIGLSALGAHYGLTRALALADASFVLPIDFLRLPCVAAVARLAYGEPIDGWTLLGAGVIFAGNYWSVRREARG